MSDLMRPGQPGESPFDAIRHVDADGEHWFARELMTLHGYTNWQNFVRAIEQAMIAAELSGVDVTSNFTAVSKVSGGRGPSGADYRLTRYAAYLVAMRGDSRKPEIAAALTYFAVKTREAETRPSERVPAVIKLDVDEYERLLDGGKQMVAKIREQRAQIETQQRELEEVHAYADDLEPDAEAFRHIVRDDGRDFSVRKAAGFISRSEPRLDIGQNDLFTKLREWGLIDRQNVPYRKWKRYVTSKPTQFTDPHTGERRWAPKDQVRVTWDGLSWMRRKLLGEIEKAAAEKQAQELDLFSSGNVTKLPARRGKKSGPGIGDGTPPGA